MIQGRTHIRLWRIKLATPTLSGILALITLASAPLLLSAMQHEPKSGEGGGLEDSMEVLQSDTKKLDKAFDKGDLETVVKLAVEMEQAVWNAKTKTPEKDEAITDAKD